MSNHQTVLWKPQPGPQTLLVQCPVFEVCYGGARGGGKTEGSIGDWLIHSAEYGEFAVGIFVRRTFKQLSEVIARTKQLFPKVGGKYNESKAEWQMANGARLKFVYLEKDSDADNYQGHSYTRVYIEEATNFPSPDPIMKLKATLRSAEGVPCGIRLTCNPGGPGHHWVKDRYIKHGPFKVIREEEEITLGDGKTWKSAIERVFIPAKITDNQLLLQSDPGYLLRLKQSGSPALVKAWLEGLWDSVDGAFFQIRKEHIILQPILIPPYWLRFRAMDWGSAKPFSVGWYAVSDGTYLPEGAIYKYREWYGMTEKANVGLKLSANLVAEGILARERGENIRYGVADPSIFANNGGPSIAEMMLVVGCHWLRGDNARQPGWEQLRKRLDGEPPLIYFDQSCYHTLRTLEAVQHDDKDPEDIDTESEDHAADETRYATMSRVWVENAPEAAAGLRFPKLPHEVTILEMFERQERRNRAPAL